MDYRALGFWVDLGWKFGTIVTLVLTLWANRKKVTAKRFESLEAEVGQMASSADLVKAEKARDEKCRRHRERTRRVEDAIHSMPSRGELSDLTKKMDGLTHNLGRLDGRLEGINRVADLMNEFLINQGGKT